MENRVYDTPEEAQSSIAHSLNYFVERMHEQDEKKALEERTASPYYTIEEAAAYIRGDEKTIRRKIADGKLPAYKVEDGRKLLVLKKDVHELLKKVE